MKWNLQEDPGSVGTFFAVDLGVDSFNQYFLVEFSQVKVAEVTEEPGEWPRNYNFQLEQQLSPLDSPFFVFNFTDSPVKFP